MRSRSNSKWAVFRARNPAYREREKLRKKRARENAKTVAPNVDGDHSCPIPSPKQTQFILCSWPSVSRKMATDNVPADPSPHFVAAAAETEEQFLNRTYQWVAEALDDEELRDEYDEAVENGVKMDWALDLHKRLLEGRTIFRTLRDTLVTEFRTCRTTSCEGWRWKFNLMMDVQGGICMLEVWLAAAGHAELCA